VEVMFARYSEVDRLWSSEDAVEGPRPFAEKRALR
jgi:hypothetical protein